MMHLSIDGGLTVTLSLFEGLQTGERNAGKATRPVIAAFLDVETTGKDPEHAQIIEIAIRPFEFCADQGFITYVFDPYVSLQDPGCPIPAEVSAVNGIFDKDVQGKAIDWREVEDILSCSALVLAFNADFDRKFVDRHYKKPCVWGCAMSQVDWSGVRRTALAQDVLCAWHGFFYPPHRALADVDAGIRLLEVSGKLPELYQRASTPSYQIHATDLPRGRNALVKARGYKWNGTVWWRDFADLETATVEADELQRLGYQGLRSRPSKVIVQPWQRFR